MNADEYGVKMRDFTPEVNAIGGTMRLYLDGKEVTDSCAQAYAPELPLYEGQGWVKLLQRDSNGSWLFNRDTGDVEYDTVHGVVWWECA